MSKSMGFEEENTYIDSTAVAHDRTPLNEFLDKIERKQNKSIVSYFKYAQTFTLSAWTWQQLTMNNVHFEKVYDNELSYYNGGVKIGKNVHRVMAQAAILGYHSPTTGTKEINIYNSRIGNNVGYVPIQHSNDYSEYWKTIETPCTPLEVQEGDVLFLNVLSENSENMETNYILLTVEVIE